MTQKQGSTSKKMACQPIVAHAANLFLVIACLVSSIGPAKAATTANLEALNASGEVLTQYSLVVPLNTVTLFNDGYIPDGTKVNFAVFTPNDPPLANSAKIGSALITYETGSDGIQYFRDVIGVEGGAPVGWPSPTLYFFSDVASSPISIDLGLQSLQYHWGLDLNAVTIIPDTDTLDVTAFFNPAVLTGAGIDKVIYISPAESIPEPGTLVLSCIGLAMIGFGSLRQRTSINSSWVQHS